MATQEPKNGDSSPGQVNPIVMPLRIRSDGWPNTDYIADWDDEPCRVVGYQRSWLGRTQIVELRDGRRLAVCPEHLVPA